MFDFGFVDMCQKSLGFLKSCKILLRKFISFQVYGTVHREFSNRMLCGTGLCCEVSEIEGETYTFSATSLISSNF